jgi:hypothetical protein
VTVRDHGLAVPAADQPFIFDRFYRSEASRGHPGSGLGLAIVRQIAENHGGRIGVEEAAGGGACFRLARRGAALAERCGVTVPTSRSRPVPPPVPRGRALRTLTTAITAPASRIPLLLPVLLVQWIPGKLGADEQAWFWRLARRQRTRRHGDRRDARPTYGGSHRRADAGARHRRPRLREHRPSVNAMRRAPAIAC